MSSKVINCSGSSNTCFYPKALCLVTARALQRYCMGVAVLLHQPCSTTATQVAVDELRQMG